MTIDLSSHAAFNRAIEYLETDGSKKAEVNNAVWGTYTATGKRVNESASACHGSCRVHDCDLIATMNMGTHKGGYGYAARQSYYRIPSDYYTKPIDVAILTRWTDWLINRSWARSYVSAPSLEFARDYGFVFTTDLPGNFALALLTLSRHAGEHNHLVKRWFDLLEAYPAMSEDTAYAIAFGIMTIDNPYGNPLTGHMTLGVDPDMKYLRNVASQNIIHRTKLACDGGFKTGVNAMYGYGSTGVASDLEKLAAGEMTADTVVIPNPFMPVAPVSRTKRASEKLLHSVMPDLIATLNHVENVRHAA